MYLEKKYINLLSSRIQHFKRRGENVWNFKCPICGDSDKNQTKTRGYIYKRKQSFLFYCHNCFRSFKFTTFLKMVAPSLYNDYLLESFQKSDDTKVPADVNEFITNPVFTKALGIPNILELPIDHKARTYIESRLVPQTSWKDIYYTDNFGDFINDLLPESGKELGSEPRIILPFYDNTNKLLGLQGRSLGYHKMKYITIKVDEECPKVYGWNKLDYSKTIYIMEGPLDSLFIPNSVASMGCDLGRVVPFIGNDNDYVLVHDCERRNKNIIRNIERSVQGGFKVCIWPDSYTFKDINEGILGGYTPISIQKLIDDNTFSGIEATMRLNQWSRI